MPVDNFVDKSLLTPPKAPAHAGLNKLLIQKAKIKLNDINDLKNMKFDRKNIFYGFPCAIFVHNLKMMHASLALPDSRTQDSTHCFTAQFRMQQNSLNDLSTNIMALQVFDCTDRVVTRLH